MRACTKNPIRSSTTLLISTLLCLPLLASAATLKGEGRGATEAEAQRQALAALAESIYVEVVAVSSSHVQGSGKREESQRIDSRSDIPLIGVQTSFHATPRDVICEAVLDSRKSLALYTGKLDELRRDIGETERRLARAGDSDHYDILTRFLIAVEQYEKHRAVAQMLGGRNLAAPSRSRASLQDSLRALEKSAATIELAAQLLTRGLSDRHAVYVSPASPHNSHEVTPFSRVLRDRLAQKLKTVGSPDKANVYFKGHYEILDKGVHVTYRLLDLQGNTLDTRMALLAPAAYAGLPVAPRTQDFDRLLHEGVVVSGAFRAEVATNRGREQVLFEENEEVELFVKLNRPGYFYAVGHVVKPGENFSYLVELAQVGGNRRFIRYVNADDANKWLSIGRFAASPPFGVESLQLIATSDDPIDRLPASRHDNALGLYLTAGTANEGVRRTRALKPKHTEADKRYQTEAVLMFTTLPKNSPGKL